ncbi:MAG TPA: lipoate--protein ligase family protein [Pirellulaceae bacterium]|nr:lipoate--protein ligase family protein [Pirellulaceae bacterium]
MTIASCASSRTFGSRSFNSSGSPLRLFELSLRDPAVDLAFEEMLLEQAEASEDRVGTLRIWEPDRTMVVLGRGSRVADEVDVDRCRSEGVPILRRCSGGGTVVGAPGCLMYAVVLSYETYPELRRLDVAHRFVMERIAEAVNRAGAAVTMRGTCDLTLDDRKVSGNALRCRRTHLLYHGTLLLDMDLTPVERLLKMPPRQPEYRAGRSHRDFVRCLTVDRSALVRALAGVWQAEPAEIDSTLIDASHRLADERYRRDDWNLRL